MKLSVNFSLKTGVTGEIPVLAILNYGYKEYDVLKQKYVYKPLKYYTGIKVKKDEWNKHLKLPHKKFTQTQLLNIEQQIRDVFHYMNLSGEFTAEKLKNALDEKIKGKKSETVKRIRLIDFLTQEVIGNPSLKKQTHQSYKTIRGYLTALEEQIGKPVYSNEFDERYFTIYMDIVRSRVKRINSVAAAFNLLRSTLRKVATRYKVPVFNITEEIPRDQKVRTAQSQKIYVNFEQIQRLIDYKPVTVHQKNIKLIMLTLLFTGVRYSDVFKVNPQFHYEKDGISFRYARFVTTKGAGKEVIIPLLKPLEDAIAENGGQLPYKIHEIQFNKHSKELFRDCGIADEITLSYTDKNRKIQFEKGKFHEFVSSHTGRRSFVSNLINHIPFTMLSKITGHKTSGGSAGLGATSIIHTYNQVSLLDNAVLFIKSLRRLQQDDQSHFIVQLV